MSKKRFDEKTWLRRLTNLGNGTFAQNLDPDLGKEEKMRLIYEEEQLVFPNALAEAGPSGLPTYYLYPTFKSYDAIKK